MDRFASLSARGLHLLMLLFAVAGSRTCHTRALLDYSRGILGATGFLGGAGAHLGRLLARPRGGLLEHRAEALEHPRGGLQLARVEPLERVLPALPPGLPLGLDLATALRGEAR